MQGLKISVKRWRCGIWTLAQLELNHNLLYMGIAAYLWKRIQKHQQMNHAWKSPLNSPRGKIPWSSFVWWGTGSWTREQNTEQHGEHDTEREGTGVPTWDSASAAVFSRKRDRNKSWKHLYQGRGERNLGFQRSVCGRSVGQVSRYMDGQRAEASWVCWRHQHTHHEHNLTSKHSHSSYVLPQPRILNVKS